MRTKLKKTIVLLVKLAVAAALLAYVFSKVHWHDATVTVDGQETVQKGFLSTIAAARPGLLAVAAVAFTLPVGILAVRWWYLLRIQRIRISLWESVRLTYLGTFFNFIVPGAVSGDLVKAYYVSRHTDKTAAVLVSVFVDRVIGLLEFAIMPAVAMSILLAAGLATRELRMPAIAVASVLATVAVSMSLLLSPRLRAALHLQTLLRRLPLQRQLAMAGQAAALYGRRLKTLAAALGITMGSQVIFIFAIFLVGQALGLPVPWHVYYVYVPLIYIVAAVPISPGGLGVVEALFVQFFAPAGAGTTETLAMVLMCRVLQLFCSLPGLLVALTGPKLPDRKEMQAELQSAAGPPEAVQASSKGQ